MIRFLVYGIVCFAVIGFCWVIVVVVTDIKKRETTSSKKSFGGTMEEKIKSIIAEQLGVNIEEVTPQALFIDDLGADSLDSMELVITLEDEFNIVIPDEDVEKLLKVEDVVKYIEEKTKDK